jgi:hypothetical protein
MLSKTKYATLCVVGTEIFYVLCIGYGLMLSGKAMEVHHSLFELIPGFAWGNVLGMLWGGLYLGVLTWIGGWYIAWMHNASLRLASER